MENQTDLHYRMNEHKLSFKQRLSATKADPFVLLLAFVQGTGNLFANRLVKKITEVCNTKDVDGYLKLAAHVDSYSQLYVSDSPEVVKGHRVLCSLLKKYPFKPSETPHDTKAVAIEKWYSAEMQCGRTNDRLSNIANGDLPKFVHYARRIIADTLGELTPAVIMKMMSDGEHGKGSTTDTKFERSSVYHKYSLLKLNCTSKAMNYAKASISLNRRWMEHFEQTKVWDEIPHQSSSPAYAESRLLDSVLSLNESERISFVLKDAKSMRPIGVGNAVNMYMQLGVKTYFMDRLKGVGVDLTDQTKNQRLALMGSIIGSMDVSDDQLLQQFSTIDLASASDTVSIGICKLLLSPEWFGLLSDLRHESGIIEGKTIVYNKMSAMGNGFTFPLESLLFWAIAKATAEVKNIPLGQDDFTVYGDDIICPLWMTADLIEHLEWSGFTVNTEKSFIKGPFKESCGADYYQGINVRPFYLKRSLTTVEDLYYVANAILPRTLDKDCQVSKGYCSLYRKIAELISQQGPINYGPLSDVFSLTQKGEAVYKDHMSSLAVPLSLFNERGIGYLTTRAKVELFNKKWFFRGPKRWHNATLSALISSNLPYVLRVTHSVEKETNVVEFNRLTTRYHSLVKQNDMHDKYVSTNEAYSIDANGTTTIAVKREGVTTFRLQPVPSWDGIANKGLIDRHPLWNDDLHREVG